MASRWTPLPEGPYLSQAALQLERPIIDTTDWTPLGYEQMGTKPKQWFEGPGGVRWLFKKVLSNPARGGGSYLRGDDWAEVIASDLARLLGLPTASVELAEHASDPGVISRSVAEGSELVHGNEVLGGQVPDYAQHADRRHPLYTVTTVLEVVGRFDPPPDFGSGAANAFVGYLLLDALVGNTDRHHQNWAILRKDPGPRRLSPTFDHASSLGCILHDCERLERLTTRDAGRTVAAYAKRASTPFADARSPTDAAVLAMATLPRDKQQAWEAALDSVGPQIADVVARVPPERMSDPSRIFARELMVHNRENLLKTLRSRT